MSTDAATNADATETASPDEPGQDEAHIELAPAELKERRFPSLRLRREQKKRRKKAKQGYIRWILIDETYPEPKYIKPKTKGGGMREYEHDGETYLFPRRAMLPSEREGMWTVIHRKGEADPVNLRDSHEAAIPSDELKEYLTLRVSSSAPSLLDKFDIEPRQILMLTIAAIVVFALLSDVMGGGV
jgi:hypothetical protein